MVGLGGLDPGRFERVALVACLHAGRRASEEAIRVDGSNMDSGGYVSLLGLFFFLPAAGLLLLAGVAVFQRWPGRWLCTCSH
jgi:hypothetical protein